MKEKNEYELFLEGKKPAILYNPHSKDIIYPACLQKIIHKYPFVDGVQVFDVRDQHLYFQSESQKAHFLKRIQNIKINSPDWHRELGLILGYPPVAIRFFLDLQQDPTLEEKKAIFKHDGMSFVGSIDDKEEIAKWLCQKISVATTTCKHHGQTILLETKKDQAV